MSRKKVTPDISLHFHHRSTVDMHFKPIHFFLFCIGIGGIFFFVYAISSPAPSRPMTLPKKITITTSFYPLFYFASRIAGDHAQIVTITPAGSEPHEYEPSPQDMVLIQNSKLLILNGAGLESWGPRITDTLKNSSVTVLTVGETIANKQDASEESGTGRDPHVWLDPVMAKEEVGVITQSLKTIDPSFAGTYEKNAQGLLDDLSALDTAYRERLARCKKNDIITSHAAFGYVAARYGFTQRALAGLSPDTEPNPQTLARISDLARERGIHTIFFETLVSPKLAQALAQEIGAETLVLNPLEGLTSSESAQGKNYLTEMKQNLTNLTHALQCQ